MYQASPHVQFQFPLVIWVGNALEGFLKKPLATLGSKARQLELARELEHDLLPLRQDGQWEAHDGSHDHDGGHGDHHVEKRTGYNPHVWLDPLLAKKIVTATAAALGEIDPENSGSLEDRLASAPGWRPLTAVALIVFIMFYAPCFVSVVCIAREAGSWKWGAFSILFNTGLAFGLSVIVYQLGTMMGF